MAPQAHPSLSFMATKTYLVGVVVVTARAVHGVREKGMEYSALRYIPYHIRNPAKNLQDMGSCRPDAIYIRACKPAFLQTEDISPSLLALWHHRHGLIFPSHWISCIGHVMQLHTAIQARAAIAHQRLPSESSH